MQRLKSKCSAPRHIPPTAIRGGTQSGCRGFSLPRLKLTVAYEGTRYAGWQLQAAHGGTGPLTIQGELERCITSLIGSRIPVHGAGRTDAGVHAEGQVCHLDVPESGLRIDWKRALNVQLPADIRVLDSAWVRPDFHSRKDALAKRYVYSLWSHRDRAVPRIQAFVWSCPELDLDRMREAFFLLEGKKDFASFRNSGGNDGDSVRTLFSVSCQPGMLAGLACPSGWPVVSFAFEGDGFLKQMVRNLMGLLVWIGQKKIRPEAIPGIVEARDRRALASPSAPASGLTLDEVLY